MTLADAQAELDAARARVTQARERHAAARAKLGAVRERAASGNVAPGELTAARDAAEVAELALEGPEGELAPLEAAVRAARSEEECERISSTLRSLGGAVNRALEAVDEALGDFALAAVAYDRFVTTERTDIESRCSGSPRVVTGRFTQPTVDAIRMVPSNAMAQLATLLLPVARVVGAERPLLDDLKEMARTAPILPRDDQ